jgi:hypothetical protein
MWYDIFRTEMIIPSRRHWCVSRTPVTSPGNTCLPAMIPLACCRSAWGSVGRLPLPLPLPLWSGRSNREMSGFPQENRIILARFPRGKRLSVELAGSMMGNFVYALVSWVTRKARVRVID